jgi:hypothetical protein
VSSNRGTALRASSRRRTLNRGIAAAGAEAKAGGEQASKGT